MRMRIVDQCTIVLQATRTQEKGQPSTCRELEGERETKLLRAEAREPEL